MSLENLPFSLTLPLKKHCKTTWSEKNKAKIVSKFDFQTFTRLLFLLFFVSAVHPQTRDCCGKCVTKTANLKQRRISFELQNSSTLLINYIRKNFSQSLKGNEMKSQIYNFFIKRFCTIVTLWYCCPFEMVYHNAQSCLWFSLNFDRCFHMFFN